MIDPRRGFVYPTNDLSRGGTSSGIDFSAGVIGYTEKFFFGFATHHLTEPNESLMNSVDVPLPRRYTGHLGASIPLEVDGGKYAKIRRFRFSKHNFHTTGNISAIEYGPIYQEKFIDRWSLVQEQGCVYYYLGIRI